VAVRDNEKKVIQAKLRRHMTVGNDAVQQVVAAKGVYNCPRAVVITNSAFTPEAEELARVHDVELVDGKTLRSRLLEMLNETWS
jgi:restriction system protein